MLSGRDVAALPPNLLIPYSSSQSQSSYIIRNPQQRRISQSQPVRGRDEEQDDIVSADVEEVVLCLIVVDERLLFGKAGGVVTGSFINSSLLLLPAFAFTF